MESFRTIFFPKYSDRTKVTNRCDSAPNAENRYDRYKGNFAAADANKPQIEKNSGQSS